MLIVIQVHPDNPIVMKKNNYRAWYSLGNRTSNKALDSSRIIKLKTEMGVKNDVVL